MYHAYKKCAEIGAIAQVHAENGDLIHEVWVWLWMASLLQKTKTVSRDMQLLVAIDLEPDVHYVQYSRT